MTKTYFQIGPVQTRAAIVYSIFTIYPKSPKRRWVLRVYYPSESGRVRIVFDEHIDTIQLKMINLRELP